LQSDWASPVPSANDDTTEIHKSICNTVGHRSFVPAYSCSTSRRHWPPPPAPNKPACRRQLKCDGTHAETRFRLSAKRKSQFKSAGTSVQPTTGSRGVRISGSNAGYTMFRGSVKSTGYPLHSPVSPSLPLSCVNVCHHISSGVYKKQTIPHVASYAT